MNALENWFCSTSYWRRVTQERLLPWLLAGCDLGAHLLEIGAGPGAATQELRRRVPRVTSLEYSHVFAAALGRRLGNGNAGVLQADAAALPFADRSFSSAIAILVLHHLRSEALQESAFAEVARVLRPGGRFLALEIEDGWFPRALHIQSTFVPVHPARVARRLTAAGFSDVEVNKRPGGFGFRGKRTR